MTARKMVHAMSFRDLRSAQVIITDRVEKVDGVSKARTRKILAKTIRARMVAARGREA